MVRRKPFSRCPVDYALEIFGDRWSLLVVRDLLAGKRYYRELLAAKEGIATNILADRLKKLEQKGIVERRQDPEDRRQVIYAVTDKGLDLLPVLLEITRWSAKYSAETAANAGIVSRYDADKEAVLAAAAERARAARVRQKEPSAAEPKSSTAERPRVRRPARR